MKKNKAGQRFSTIQYAPLGLTLALFLGACGNVKTAQKVESASTDALHITIGSNDNHLSVLGIDPEKNKIGVLTRDNRDANYIENQYIARVADASSEAKLQKLLKKYNGVILDNGDLLVPPSGHFIRDPGPRIYKLIQLTVPITDSDKITDIAKQYVTKGEMKFSSQTAADAYAFVADTANEDTKGLNLELNLAGVSQAATPSSQENLDMAIGRYSLAADQWWLQDSADIYGTPVKGINAFNAWNNTDYNGKKVTGSGVMISIIDRGFAYQNRDMVNSSSVISIPWEDVRTPYYMTVANNSINWSTATELNVIGSPVQWHGMEVAGLAMASVGNYYGLAGVAPKAAPLLLTIGANYVSGLWGDPLILNSYYDAGKAVDQSVASGAKVINMSFGFNSPGALGVPGTSLGASLQNADNQGVIAVASAGNQGNLMGKDGQLNYSTSITFVPAAWKTVIGVGATDMAGNRSIWPNFGSSNYGSIVDIWAPGSAISVLYAPDAPCYPDCSYFKGQSDGTSFSSPLIAGAVALMAQVKPNITRTQALQYMQATSKKNVGAEVNAKGIIDVAAAVALAKANR